MRRSIVRFSPRVGLAITFAVALGTGLGLAGCSGTASDDDDDMTVDAAPERFIATDDPEHQALEQPEQSFECNLDGDCEDSCVHSCIPSSALPITCPVEPLPLPARLEGTDCRCVGELNDRCAWVQR